MTHDDPRRHIPRTDTLLALPEVKQASAALGERVVLGIIHATQDRARRGELPPEAVAATVLETLSSQRPASLHPIINATGVIVHTNIGRAPLSPAAVDAVVDAAGYVDLELDLASGTRSRRGTGARAALLAACPDAEDALIVNNAAAALVLATTTLAGTAPTGGREVLMSRGEFIEIGAGFRLSDLIASTGARIREVGTTNRTHLDDYKAALSDKTGCVLKIHPSNYRVEGFTAEATVTELATLCRERGVPLIADLGSGLLEPDPLLPDEPDAASALRAGADVVIASGDKLLGGPQSGILLGRSELIAQIARHPLARAVRADKLALAALEATVSAGTSPVREALHADSDALLARTRELAERVANGLATATRPGVTDGATAGAIAASASEKAPSQDSTDTRSEASTASAIEVIPHDGRVGGGGGVGVPLAGWALALPLDAAARLRTGTPAVLPRIHADRCLVDLRCVPAHDDAALATAIIAALRAAECA
ncbi:L-seryl-tRNA(Sec) selenium transferase [Gulosibacter macacae]|uniref:L-seryl-tRNA(Sec) selenium transferase n=1 Tax=Gulosibacter macacae TaxID=2488791 RepID=A0A3P3VZA4_9MICO|nr:L-seryl-tRNA(Sec) selenium transferase [Gulosibacter macacae]RRJ86956.1 L-seryl-tRNA(Sec) selenium transferase [Gulosibacter macacae]